MNSSLRGGSARGSLIFSNSHLPLKDLGRSFQFGHLNDGYNCNCDKRNQRPAWNADSKQSPLSFGAFSRSSENNFQRLCERMIR